MAFPYYTKRLLIHLLLIQLFGWFKPTPMVPQTPYRHSCITPFVISHANCSSKFEPSTACCRKKIDYQSEFSSKKKKKKHCNWSKITVGPLSWKFCLTRYKGLCEVHVPQCLCMWVEACSRNGTELRSSTKVLCQAPDSMQLPKFCKFPWPTSFWNKCLGDSYFTGIG